MWGWVDSISLKVGDLDHVVVTRRGGVVVIDSKWRHEVTPHDAQDMARSALKAKLRVEAVARSLPHLKLVGGSTARHHISGVTPVVVIWGAAQHSLPDDAMLDGVAVVAGKQLVAWLQQLHGAEITKNEAVDLLDDLERFRTSTARSA
ncbi:hypothetical protein [Nocardioides caldifontis]|uniref:hypothetical protein n=1 Tax=Nocardioides caldifontis TaxID=2588938 RepID=UPI00193A8191|nr:hypothetical protein [Nocardioides caldifontis]